MVGLVTMKPTTAAAHLIPPAVLSTQLEPLRWFFDIPAADLHSLTESQAQEVKDLVEARWSDLRFEDVEVVLKHLINYDLPYIHAALKDPSKGSPYDQLAEVLNPNTRKLQQYIQSKAVMKMTSKVLAERGELAKV